MATDETGDTVYMLDSNRQVKRIGSVWYIRLLVSHWMPRQWILTSTGMQKELDERFKTGEWINGHNANQER